MMCRLDWSTGSLLLIIFIISSQYQLASAEECEFLPSDPCTCVYKNAVISFEDFPREILATHGGLHIESEYTYTYYYSPCRLLRPPKNESKCAESMLCQKANLAKKVFAIGSKTVSAHGIPETSSFYFEYGVQKTEGDYRKSRVYLICDADPAISDFVFINQTDGQHGKTIDDPYIFEFSYRGPEGCLQHLKEEQHKLSAGSVLLIILLVVVLLYMVIGLSYNKFYRGAVGVEIIPNYEFWADLPFLIKDGVLFTLKCGCCGDSQPSGYDNI